MRGETLRKIHPMHLRPVAPLRKTNNSGWAQTAKKKWAYGEGEAKRKRTKKRRGIQLGLKTILDAGEEGAKVGEPHIFDSKLILQRVCIVSSDIGYMDPVAILEDHNLNRVLVNGVLVISFQPNLVPG